MRRREFIALLGTAIVASRGRRACAQAKIYRIGHVNTALPMTETSPFGAPLIGALAKRDYVQNKNIVLEGRGAEGHSDRLPHLIKELVASQVDVIVAAGYPAALAAKEGTTIPVVAFSTGDPVGTGLVASLARPGGNLTGISDLAVDLTPKRMDLLKQMVPALRRLAMLWNANDLGMTFRYRASEKGAQSLGIQVQAIGVREPNDLEAAFTAMTREKPDAILVVTDPLMGLNRKRIFEFTTANRLPAMYEFDFIVRDGGLMSYAPDLDEVLDRVAALVDRILKGAKPADLPLEQPTRFKLAINLKAAKAIGLEVPPMLLAFANELIE
jgi:putative tryptophan/tyrosine transport system substrate-binding protein